MKAPGRAALRRQLVRLEKRWGTGVLAPHQALALCLESDLPRHEWPAWIEPAVRLFSVRSREGSAPARPSRPLTSTEQTRFLATMAEKLFDRIPGVSAKRAARAAVSAMRAYGWEHGDNVVERVRKEVFKLTKDRDNRAVRYSAKWDEHALDELAKQGKKPR